MIAVDDAQYADPSRLAESDGYEAALTSEHHYVMPCAEPEYDVAVSSSAPVYAIATVGEAEAEYQIATNQTKI